MQNFSAATLCHIFVTTVSTAFDLVSPSRALAADFVCIETLGRRFQARPRLLSAILDDRLLALGGTRVWACYREVVADYLSNWTMSRISRVVGSTTYTRLSS